MSNRKLENHVRPYSNIWANTHHTTKKIQSQSGKIKQCIVYNNFIYKPAFIYKCLGLRQSHIFSHIISYYCQVFGIFLLLLIERDRGIYPCSMSERERERTYWHIGHCHTQTLCRHGQRRADDLFAATGLAGRQPSASATWSREQDATGPSTSLGTTWAQYLHRRHPLGPWEATSKYVLGPQSGLHQLCGPNF